MTDKTSSILSLVYIAVTIILFIVVFIFLNKHNKKKYRIVLEELERNKNLIISGSILTELNKLSSLINNSELEKKYHVWQNRYKKIKEEDIPVLDDKLNELEELFKTNKFKKINEAIAKLELEIYYVKSKSEFLLKDIKDITLSATKNREIVTTLKTNYRETYLKYHHNIDDYEIIKKPIELQFENIDKLFASFETAMDNNDYAEAPKIVKALDDTVGNIVVVINEAPGVILMGKKLIPEKIENIEEIYHRLLEEGYNLDFLNVDYNISEANKKIADIFDRLNVLNLTDSVIELQTIEGYFDSLYSDFENEKKCKKSYEEGTRKVGVKCSKLLSIVQKLSSKIEDIKYSYDLEDKDVLIIDELNLSLKSLQNDYEILVENYRNKSFSYSKLNNELTILTNKLKYEEERVNQTLKNIASLKEDEIRAHEQLEEIESILKQSKDKLSEFKLPIIPNNYYVETKEATDAINVMIDELNKKPVSIKTLNIRVDTARDLVLKLYKTTTECIKNAKLAENTILYGNRFRTYGAKINNGLEKAENEFYAGRYKESLEYAINSIAEYDPDIHKRILKVKNDINDI